MVAIRFSKRRSKRLNLYLSGKRPHIFFPNSKSTKVVIPCQRRRADSRRLQQRVGNKLRIRQHIFAVCDKPLLRVETTEQIDPTNITVEATKRNTADYEWCMDVTNVGIKAEFLLGVLIDARITHGSASQTLDQHAEQVVADTDVTPLSENPENVREINMVGIQKDGSVVRKRFRFDDVNLHNNETLSSQHVHVHKDVLSQEVLVPRIKKGDSIHFRIDGPNQAILITVKRGDEKYLYRGVNLGLLNDYPFADILPVVFGHSVAIRLGGYVEKPAPLLHLAMLACEQNNCLKGAVIATNTTPNEGESEEMVVTTLEKLEIPYPLRRRIDDRLFSNGLGSTQRLVDGNFELANPTAHGKTERVCAATLVAGKYQTVISDSYDTQGNIVYSNYGYNDCFHSTNISDSEDDDEYQRRELMDLSSDDDED